MYELLASLSGHMSSVQLRVDADKWTVGSGHPAADGAHYLCADGWIGLCPRGLLVELLRVDV